MTRDIFISGVIALLLHGLILSLPTAGGDSRPLVSRPGPIALSVVHPRAPVTAPAQGAAQPCPAPSAPEPRPKRKAPAAPQKTILSRTAAAVDTCPAPEKRPASPKPREKVSAPGPAPLPQKESTPVQGISQGPDPQEGVEPASPAPTMEPALARGDLFLGGDETLIARQADQQGKDVVVFARPKYRENPAPPYPKVARQRGYEGETLLRVEVLETGGVGLAEIAASSGFGMLDRAALDSVKDWGFVPGTKNGKRIRQWVVVPIRFSLR